MKGKTAILVYEDSDVVNEFDINIMKSRTDIVKLDRTKTIKAFIKEFNKNPSKYLAELNLIK